MMMREVGASLLRGEVGARVGEGEPEQSKSSGDEYGDPHRAARRGRTKTEVVRA
jgi:hypothetical protein